jgi:hypothetical protein
MRGCRLVYNGVMKAKKAKRESAIWRHATEKRAMKTVDMSRALIKAVRCAEMDPRHNHLDALMEPTKDRADGREEFWAKTEAL